MYVQSAGIEPNKTNWKANELAVAMCEWATTKKKYETIEKSQQKNKRENDHTNLAFVEIIEPLEKLRKYEMKCPRHVMMIHKAETSLPFALCSVSLSHISIIVHSLSSNLRLIISHTTHTHKTQKREYFQSEKYFVVFVCPFSGEMFWHKPSLFPFCQLEKEDRTTLENQRRHKKGTIDVNENRNKTDK